MPVRPIEDDLLEPAVKAYIGVVFLAFERRNTWGGPFLYRHGSIGVALQECQRFVEDQRVRGSAWQIRECPALVVCGTSVSLIAADPGGFSDGSRFEHGTTDALRPVLDAIVSRLHVGIVKGVSDTPPNRGTGAFRRWSSLSSGGGYSLTWSESRNEEDCRPIHRWVRAIERSARTVGYLGIVHAETDGGRRVTEFLTKSPLHKKGIRAGDVLMEFVSSNGTSLLCAEDLPALAARAWYTARVRRGKRSVSLRLLVRSPKEMFRDRVNAISRLIT